MGNEIQTAAPVDAKKEKRNSIIITICVILAAVLIIGLTVFNRLTDTGYFLRSETAAESENFEVDGAMMTYFFHSNYQAYAGYSSYLGFDPSISLKAQECSLSQGATWFDYFASLTQSYVNELLALCEAAKANGVLFYPICPDAEAQSWAEFEAHYIDRFLNHSYAGEAEEACISHFETLLPEEPTWEKGAWS